MSDLQHGDAGVPPRSIGKYRIDGVLGTGGMGVVYRAYDPVIDRMVALKTIRADLLEGPQGVEWRERFKREARAAARCDHPNIVTVFEYGEQDGTAFMAMEFVAGRSLHQLMTERARLDPTLALRTIEQVLDALEYSHARGVVHRDIKPSNVILVEGGRVKVTDFGIARIDAITATQYTSFVGTPSYMAPERFTGALGDRRSDLFAVGVVLFELLTGERPFPGQTTTEVMYRVLHHSPRDATLLNPAISPALNAVMQRAMARDPEARYQSAAAFAGALKLAASIAAVGRPEASPDPATTALAAPREPAAIEPVAPTGSAGPVASRGGLPGDVLRKAEEDLAFHIGPLAKILVKKAAAEAGSLGELYAALAVHIRAEAERAEFLEKGWLAAAGMMPPGGSRDAAARRHGTAAATPAPAGPPAGAFKPAAHELERVRQDLTVFVGPIAQILVRKAAPQAASLAALYQLLAEHIPNEQERTAFLRKAPPR